MTFADFNFHPALVEGLEAFGYEHPTPVQEKAIPAIIRGDDIIATAQTGTGKTAAFLLPILQALMDNRTSGSVQALIIVPTRELAQQIDQHMEGLSYFTHIGSCPVYGGTDGAVFSREMEVLSRGTEVVICTPGRMIAHLLMGYVKLDGLKYLVLDEADRMLDMGFHDDIMRILSYLPEKRQNLMFSATMKKEIRQLAAKILRNPVEVNIALAKPADKVLQIAYVLRDHQKLPLLKYLLLEKEGRIILVFCSTKDKTKEVNRALRLAGIKSQEIHSDLDQQSRERVLMDFKNRETQVLVATDVLSRGIDIEDIDMVINYDVPGAAEDYIHRIGRTARAASEGAAITLIGEKEQRKFGAIENLLGKTVYKALLPVHLGESPPYDPKARMGSMVRKRHPR